jgi:hypothetical protein
MIAVFLAFTNSQEVKFVAEVTRHGIRTPSVLLDFLAEGET